MTATTANTPHNYDKNCIVYTGTHDNQTTRGWYEENNRKVQKYIRDYLRVKSGKDVVEAMIATAMSSTAGTAVIPMQDWLGLGREARMNFPSTLGDNWKWRLTDGQLTDALAAHMKDVTKTCLQVICPDARPPKSCNSPGGRLC